ncbi:MAG TPA: TlpA disulfide reductase family protein [Niabella sp.]|jgi:thiol-disulfide isomerase/thioredoxin|nr:TlpA family protein disulfide reductase [Chitinophagaceae bacterium]HRN46991.1 TlpA disulfide reductase family protein [Niabella sp.]HUN03275.1 TlpA disulfide reductase family protein [Niabella sp.]
MKSILFILAILSFGIIQAQNNFSYIPQKPKPGDEITITYMPGADLEGLLKIPEAFILESSADGNNVTNIKLSRLNGRLTAKFVTDTATRFVALGFMDNDKYDSNNDDGFIILLYDGNQPYEKANAYASNFYDITGKARFGILRDKEKALSYLVKEVNLYPAGKKSYYTKMVKLQYQMSPITGTSMVQKEIEQTIKMLKTKEDYTILSSLYNLLSFDNQSKFIDKLKTEKFPEAPLSQVDRLFRKGFSTEGDAVKQQAILDELTVLLKNADDASLHEASLNMMRQAVARDYLRKKDAVNFKKVVNTITDNTIKYRMCQNAAGIFMNDINTQPQAISFAKDAMNWAKSEVNKPKEKKPAMAVDSEWKTTRINSYAGAVHTYAQVLEKSGKYTEAFKYAKEAAAIKPGIYSHTYITIAQKILNHKQVKVLAEDLVKSGAANNGVVDILKEIYNKTNNTKTDFESYLAGLKNEAKNKVINDLRSEMLNISAPEFTLVDIDGKTVNLADYKNKVVVLDFWATWCGPCKASFPAMQKAVIKYNENPDVKFLFIDTWERVEDKVTPAKDFISSNKYRFHVLIDNEDKVVGNYRVEGLPTKIIIGKDGKIKFKDIGYSGSEEGLIEKLSMMIALASE